MENLAEKLLKKEYSENTQKFLFYIDGIQAFSPEPITELCEFIHSCVEHDPNQIDVLMILGSLMRNLNPDESTKQFLRNICRHIEILYPDNDFEGINIESLDVLQTIRSGIMRFLSLNTSPIWVEPPHQNMEENNYGS